jgi:hypothetical protein
LADDVSLRAPKPLHSDHRVDALDWGKAALDAWHRRDARPAQGSGSAKAYILSDGEHVADCQSVTGAPVDTAGAQLGRNSHRLTHAIGDEAARFCKRFGYVCCFARSSGRC